ncbi:fatty acyl-CoA reductase 2 [Trichonephila clavata]|uniref:Fatty acyl-CoA reductase 2 n=1 Tax=Trichonephila clavata TaxID=2740835 RepID=A0A8X6F3S3_TRICU|nr:fatty acyl-CoA reductase 2 [Trichonephila clavata]
MIALKFFQGYAEEYSSLAQLIIAIGKGFHKVLLATPDVNLEVIPADVVANAHIIAAYGVANGRYSSPFVVNCAPFGLPLHLTYMVTMLLKLINTYPVPNAFRYSNNVWIVNSKVEKTLLTIFEHYIPAVGIDLMLILQGKKPRLFSLYRFLDRVMNVSEPFLTRRVEFATENLRDLQNAVSLEKAEELYTDLEGFNVEEFMGQLTGTSQYDWKNDKKTKSERLKLINR